MLFFRVINCMSRVIVWTYNTSGSRKHNNTLGPDPGQGQEHLCHVYPDSTVALLKSALAPASPEPQATSPEYILLYK